MLDCLLVLALLIGLVLTQQSTQYEAVAATYSTDRVCAAVSTCQPGSLCCDSYSASLLTTDVCVQEASRHRRPQQHLIVSVSSALQARLTMTLSKQRSVWHALLGHTQQSGHLATARRTNAHLVSILTSGID